MDFDGFELMPRTRAEIPLQRRIGAILEAEKIVERGPRCNRIVAWVEDPIPTGTTLPAAHANWNGPDLPTVDGFPARPLDAGCPPGLIRVAVGIPGQGHRRDGVILRFRWVLFERTRFTRGRKPVGRSRRARFVTVAPGTALQRTRSARLRLRCKTTGAEARAQEPM